ncbi:MAG: RidA family protein [Bacteriovoracia bacterium]
MPIIRKETKQRMSRIVVHNGTAYFCGQVAKDTTQGIQEQTKTTLEKIDELLASINIDKTHLLSTTIYLKDMKDFQAMNEVWDSWVPQGHAPARACVQAAMAREEILVEMSVVAAVE